MDIVNIITLIAAVITCFFGYRLNKTLIAVMGLIIGFNLGLTYLPNIITDQTIIYVVSIVMAILVGLISYNLYLVGVFLLCAIAIYILCENLSLDSNVKTLVGMIAGLIAGILGIKFTRPLMIISTSLGGASLLTNTAFALLNFQNTALSFIIIIVIAILGMLYQFKQSDNN